MTSPEERADAVIEALRGHPMLLMALQRKLPKVKTLRAWRKRKNENVWYRANAQGVSQVTVRRHDDGPEVSFHAGGFYIKERFAMPSAQEAMAAVDEILEGQGVVLAR